MNGDPDDPPQTGIQGLADGARWARSLATSTELRRAERLNFEHEDGLFAILDTGSSHGSAAELFFQLRPECRGDRDAALAFWRGVTSRADPGSEEFSKDLDYLFGFHEGALEVWHEIKGRW